MIIGRHSEREYLLSLLDEDKSHFISIYGRRRIGKTFLIRETFGNRFTFSHAGISDGSLEDQLFAFSSSLQDAGHKLPKAPSSWLLAFESLKTLVKESKESKKIIFLDELSWMDTPKSGFVTALEHFWNGFASARKDVFLIVCASATSWMLSKIIHNKGGLYNRLSGHINLTEFSLAECEEYTKSAGLSFNRIQILQYYMIFGGVPYYWEFLQKGLSLFQCVDKVLFSKEAKLKDEFKYLYSSIFKNPEYYTRIIEVLGTKKIGMTREEIIKQSGLNNSGDLTTRLEELISCGFIRKYMAFGSKKKNATYQLMDCFTLFYYRFLKDCPTDENFWSNQINTPAVNTWLGLSFEMVCMKHIEQIKKKLGISGVLTDINSWSCRADSNKGIFGSQIDLLICRKDQVINLCEMKYSGTEYTITRDDEQSIQRKISDFTRLTKTKYAIYPTYITTYGLVDNAYSYTAQSVITMEDLYS